MDWSDLFWAFIALLLVGMIFAVLSWAAMLVVGIVAAGLLLMSPWIIQGFIAGWRSPPGGR